MELPSIEVRSDEKDGQRQRHKRHKSSVNKPCSNRSRADQNRQNHCDKREYPAFDRGTVNAVLAARMMPSEILGWRLKLGCANDRFKLFHLREGCNHMAG